MGDIEVSFDLREAVERLLAGTLGAVDFDRAVQRCWDDGRFVQRFDPVDRVAARILEQAARPRARYESRDAPVPFRYQELSGAAGCPGAVHVDAPPEARASPLIRDKNRAAHFHEGARISIVTRGRARVFVHRAVQGRDCVVEAGLQVDDIVLWPDAVAHTFDAGRDGFSLLTAMSRFKSSKEEGFATPAEAQGLDFDALPRLSYGDYLRQLR